ncbi:hypothetical protein RRG08_045786 [Elysia crispata]|uniref:Uncharacterized protein n=1 Tax=Elysia crispata TaxID=231223 RepID=A0AAE1B036_9GAST|nr:hypothetical protein RRG08_045786 [Elysia crispata]
MPVLNVMLYSGTVGRSLILIEVKMSPVQILLFGLVFGSVITFADAQEEIICFIFEILAIVLACPGDSLACDILVIIYDLLGCTGDRTQLNSKILRLH